KITHPGFRPHYPALAGSLPYQVPTVAHECFRLSQGNLQENGLYRAIFRDLQTVGFGKLSLDAAPWRGTGSRLGPLSRRENQTCGLSLASFKNYLNPPLLSGSLTNDTTAKKVAVQSNHSAMNEATAE